MQSTGSKTPMVKSGLGKVLPGKLAADAEAKKRQRIYRGGVAALLLVVLVAWWFLRPNAQMAKVKHLQEELFGPQASSLSPEEKKQKMEEFRAESEKLSPADRKEARKEMMNTMQAKQNIEAVKYLAMSPAERRQVIDAKIAKEQSMQQKRAANPGGGGPGPNGAGGANGVAVQGGGPGGGGGGPGAGPGGAQKGGISPETQDERRRTMLLHASAEARAGMDQMRLDMATRRAQLGLPPTPTRGGPPR